MPNANLVKFAVSNKKCVKSSLRTIYILAKFNTSIFSRACFYESRATYPVTIVCACVLVCLLACLLVDSSCEKYTTGGACIFNNTI